MHVMLKRAINVWVICSTKEHSAEEKLHLIGLATAVLAACLASSLSVNMAPFSSDPNQFFSVTKLLILAKIIKTLNF